MKRLRTAVLISGSGRTLANFIEQAGAGTLPIEIVLVISSHADVKGNDITRAAGIPLEIIPRKGTPKEEFDRRIDAALDAARPDLVCLAGFICHWQIPARYDGKVMNIHPALIPRYCGKGFHGHHVHEAVLASGDRESGCTVHFANNDYDAGPIILQKRVPVLPDDTPDTLAARVFEQETIAYPEAIRLFAAGRLQLSGGKVLIRD